MPKISTVGKILLKSHIPADMHAQIDEHALDAKGLSNFFSKLSDKSPEAYKKTVSGLTRLGFEVATRQGSSISLGDLVSPVDKDKYFKKVEAEAEAIEKSNISKAEKDKKIADLYYVLSETLNKDILAEGLKHNKTLAKVILSGSRGSPTQYRQTVAAPVLVADAKGRPMTDFAIKSSFAEGLTLPEYLAHSYTTRKGMVGTKLCCFEDTEVLMADFTVRRIKDVRVGEWVIGADKEGFRFPVKVTNVFNNGKRDCFKYIFRKNSSQSDFAEIIATKDHKVLAKFKLGYTCHAHNSVYTPTPLALEKTRKGIFIAYPGLGLKNAGGIKEPAALFMGLMLGDGCTRGQDPAKGWLGSMSFACADQLLIDAVTPYLARHNYQLKKQQKAGYGYSLTYIDKPKRIKLRGPDGYGLPRYGTGCPIKLLFNEYGLMNCLAHDKIIHPKVWGWNNDSIAQLLAGLFVTDGSFCPTRRNGYDRMSIRFQLTSEQLVRETKRLLEYRFGIYTSPVFKVAKETKEWATHDQYGFNISQRKAVALFHKAIPLVGIKKRTLDGYMASLSEEYVHDTEYSFGFCEKIHMGMLPTYDLEVDHPDHLFCLPNGLIISNSVASAGYVSKQLSRATMTVKVEEHDCGTDNGIDVSTTDKDSIGSYLAHPAGEYKKNNEVTNKMLGDLANKKITSIIVRSPITCQSSKKFHVGAVCQLCIGKRERGGNPAIGEYVGLAASTTLGERLAQSQLNSKHSGSSSQKVNPVSGFALVNQLFNIPDTFKGKAALAFHDGEITDIKTAAQGGHYIMIGKEEHYVPAGFEVKVKKGQHVEAGDVMSEGIPDPSEVVRFKGIGEGRKYFTTVLKNTFQDAGMPINRRNFEVISKAAIDHVRVTNPEGIGDILPNQVASYQAVEKGYKPRSNAKLVRVDLAYNKYLEVPVLHYTVGTRITKSIIDNLKKHKIESVTIHDDEPGFHPEMQRLLDVPAFHEDWMHQLYSTYLEKRFNNAVNTASKSSITGASPIAGIAHGVGFGEKKAELLKEAGNGGDKGCLMGYIDENSATKIVAWVEDNVSKDKLHEKGIERCCHITVLYGFDSSVSTKEISTFLEAHKKPITLTLKNISIFETPDSDVLKIDVKSDDLQKLNAAIREEFKDRVDITYPNYIPHLTLAYLKKGEGKKLVDNAKFNGDIHIFKELVYSTANGDRKSFLPLEKKAEEQYLSSGLEYALGQLKEAGIKYALGGDYTLRDYKEIGKVDLFVDANNMIKAAEELKIAEVEDQVQLFDTIEQFEKVGFDLDDESNSVVKFASVIESKQKSKDPNDQKDLIDVLTRLQLK